MRFRWASSSVAVAAVALLLGVPASSGQSDPGGDRRLELERIRARVGSLRAELAELEQVGLSVEAELERLDLELRLQRQMVAEAAAERELTEESLQRSIERVEALEISLSEARARLAGRIVALYRETPTEWLRGLASVREPPDLFLYLRTLRYLARRDARALPVYLEQREELAAERDRLELRREAVSQLAARERRRLDQLAKARRRQRLVAAALDRERDRLQSAAASLDDKESKLALLITVLADPEEAPMAEAPIQDFRGALDWPVDGMVTVPFGPRHELRYGTAVPHNGIQIEPSGDRDVRAVFPGVVIFASSFEGFGPTVVVHHRTKVFTLYAGLDGLQVAKNDVVALGEVLGAASEALYFAIRVENRPEDPIGWLR